MLHQNRQAFHYEIDKTDRLVTAWASLPLVTELFYRMGLDRVINEEIGARRTQGYTDAEQILSLILLNIAGGESVEDLKMLEGDPGFRKLQTLLQSANAKSDRKGSKSASNRWRKERKRCLPSVTAVRDYLGCFEYPAESVKRGMGRSFIPASNEHLSGFKGVMTYMLSWLQERSPEKVATLDQDATLIPTENREALFNFKKERSYQALNTYYAERDLVIHTEFRDGNVLAGYEQLRVFKESISQLPEGVKEVYLRSDTAGYQLELMKYCADPDDAVGRRFDVIKFAISCDVGKEFMEVSCRAPEDRWVPIMKEVRRNGAVELEYTGQECAVVSYVPSDVEARNKDGSEFRYIAIREKLSNQKQLPFKDSKDKKDIKSNGEQLEFEETPNIKKLHIETMNGFRYKLFGIATNIMDTEADKVVLWQRKRCGSSEQVHDVLKNQLGGGHVPSEMFGANAAWWWISVLALNLQNILKSHILPAEFSRRKPKGMRFGFYNIAGRVVHHAGQWIVRLNRNNPVSRIIMEAQWRLLRFCSFPT
ncbi:transposase [Acetomicrobium sp. UBA5826]|uniref:transposase n=1 Tax=Acetomicrobium sp. UBA5826 TaxID=1946039 RepID=UPI00257DCB1E|nr:transposase [Acetomicrobium sp. UBA5826]